MLRILGILLLLAAGGLAWLTWGDRMSPAALDVVELNGRLGIPVPIPLAGLGMLLVLASLRGRKRPPPRPRAQPRPRRTTGDVVSQAPDGGGWLQEICARALALRWEEGVRLELDMEANIPFALRLERVTPERARRAMDEFARFLASIPTPRRARVIFVDCQQAAKLAPHRQADGVFRRHMPSDAYRIVGQQDWADVLFSQPDTRWQAHERLPPGCGRG